MKKLAKISSLLMLVLSIGMLATSCSKDDDNFTPNSAYSGTLSSSVPMFPDFQPSDTDLDVEFEYKGNEGTITIAPFEVVVKMPQVNHTIAMGEMKVPVTLTWSDSSVKFANDNFEVQAGQWLTSGSIEGVITAEGMTFTAKYKPGSMPFECQSVFRSK